MKISVVVATFNGEKYIGDLLDSLQRQTRRVDEVLFFDDCSTDKTVEIVKTYIRDYELEGWKIEVNASNVGWEKNFAEGLQLATGDVIFPCDQDDIWHTDKVEKMLSEFNKNQDMLVLACGYNQFDDEGIIQKYKEKDGNLVYQVKLEKDYYYAKFPGCSMAISKNIIPDFLKCWFNKTPHDAVLCGIANISEQLYVYDEVLLEHRLHGNNASYSMAHDFIYKINEVNRTKKINEWYTKSKYYKKENDQLIIESNIWCDLRLRLLTECKIRHWFRLFKYRDYYHSPRQYLGDLYYYTTAFYMQIKKSNREALLHDLRMKIDIDAYENIFQRPILKYKLRKIRLSEIRRYENNTHIPVEQTIVYKYIKSDDFEEGYRQYCKLNNKDKPGRSVELLAELRKEMDDYDYDITKGVIVINQYKCLVDGQHRVAYLLNKYGKDFYVTVLQIFYLYRTPRGHLMNLTYHLKRISRK